MIPKKIHYCWFGKNSLPDEVKKYIASWRQHCPDYEIIEWNESNFNVDENSYCREAYKSKKWAFVSDYVRLKVLYLYGGFYMDTDVEILKPLDPLRNYEAVSGYESPTHIATGTLAACPNNEWIRLVLDNYEDRHFILPDGNYDTTTNVIVITQLTREFYKLNLNGEVTYFGNNMVLLPVDYLCAKSLKTGRVEITENTYTIHHFSGSWVPESNKRQLEYYQKFYMRLERVPSEYLRNKIAGALSVYCTFGWRGLMSQVKKKCGF